MQISFENNLQYTSLIASDFSRNNVKLKITSDFADNSDVITNTENVDDLSDFTSGDDVAITHQFNDINYSGFLDDNFIWLGETFDLIYNPVMVTSAGTTTRMVAFTAQSSITGRHKRFLYREQFGTNGSATPRVYEIEDDGNEPFRASVQSVDAATSDTRFYLILGNGDDLDYKYTRFRINNNNLEERDIANESGLPTIPTGYRGYRIHSWSDISYTVMNHGGGFFAVVGVKHSSGSGTPFQMDIQSFTGNKAVASTRAFNDLYVIANGNLYLYPGDQDPGQAGEKLDHSGTPGTLSPTVVGTYTGYYFTRAFFDDPSSTFWLIGDVAATTGELPGNFTQQKLYKSNITMSTITEIGTINMGYDTNRDVINISDSQLYMFPGASIDVIFDANTETIVNSSSRIQDNSNQFGNNYLLTGASKVSRESAITLLTYNKESDPTIYTNSEWGFVTVTAL